LIHAIGPPKIVQILNIGDISSTWPQGNTLDSAFYDGLRIAFYVAIRIHAGTKGRTMSTSESLGNVVAVHPLDPADASVIAQIRSATRAQKGVRWRIDAPKQFDALMEAVSPRTDVTFESATVGDVPGLWVHPASSRSDEAILHVHGGWFSAGSARAYRHLVGHIAARAGTRAFVPDYRLAPEHPFPAAVDDVLATYRGMDGSGIQRIAVTGDSAG
jgi:monoterpene epsilon-lactone hydrolase